MVMSGYGIQPPNPTCKSSIINLVEYICTNGLIKEANLTSATMLNVARNDLIRKSLTQFVYPEDQDNFYLIKKVSLKPVRHRTGRCA